MTSYYTIGIAGHIDHGKTTLTKALTGVRTDRLKEEKTRSISIEPGFAPFIQEENLEVAIIDVPGHENFIRQMIAGVAGIDLVIVVIAADEGIMPQTKEHLDVLSLLGITNGLVVITKIDQTDEELIDIVSEDVKEQMKQTFLEGTSIHFVDSLSMKGISQLKKEIREEINTITKRKRKTPFRLPIDQVFTVRGQGVVVRGTIYNGEVRQGDHLQTLPNYKAGRVRQIQSHHKQQSSAIAGQRAAINIGGINYEDVSRGDVLVVDDFYDVSDRIDIVFHPLKDIQYKIKQRQLVKLHIGTAEVMGTIVFFDRNEIHPNETEEVLCQIQLNEEVVISRGDRFILRRPTPVETIGGGWIIESNSKRHRFGKDTIDQLQLQKEGSTEDRIVFFMKGRGVVTHDELVKHLSITNDELHQHKHALFEIEEGYYTLQSILENVKDKIITLITEFQTTYPMRIGINKAEIISGLKNEYPVLLIEFAITSLEQDRNVKTSNEYVSLYATNPTLPEQWKVKLEQVEQKLIKQGAEVAKWSDLINESELPPVITEEFYYYLVETSRAFVFDNNRLISKRATKVTLEKLKKHTELESFNLQIAREVLQLTRKNLVPLLELFDYLGYTKRVGNNREWVHKV